MKVRAVALIMPILLLAAPRKSEAQAKFDKAIKEANLTYESGDYKKATELLEKFRVKTERKLGKQNRYTISYLLAMARIGLAQGMTTEFENYLQQAAKLSLASNPNGGEEHAAVLLEAADLMRRQGNIRQALQGVEQAKLSIKSLPKPNPALVGELDLVYAECLTAQGYYKEALQFLTEKRSVYENRAARQETYTDERGQPKTRKLDEDDIKQRFQDYARYLTAVANVSRLSGDLVKSETAFHAAGDWISRNLGRFSPEYVRNQIDYSIQLMENGLRTDGKFPQHSGPELAYNNIREQHKPTHYLAMEALELLLKRVKDEGDIGKYASLMLDYERLVNEYFPKNSLYGINRKLFDFSLREVRSTAGNLASEAAILLASSPNLPRNHVLAAMLNQFLFDYSITQKNYRGAEPYLSRVIDIQSTLIGKEAPVTHLTRLKLANYLMDYTNKLKESLTIYRKSYDSIVAPQIGFFQKDHLNILTHQANLYEITDQYTLATETLERAGRVARNKYSPEDPLYAQVLVISANLRIDLGQYQKSEEELDAAYKILNLLRKDPAWKVEWVNLLEAKARLMGVKGSFAEAEEFLDRAQTVIRKSVDEKLQFDDQAAARNLTTLNIQLGRYTQADEMLEKTLAEYERVFGPSSIRLIEPLVNKGRLQLARGEYPEAERTATRAYNIAISVYGEKSTKSAIAQKLLGELNFQLGDFEQAEDNFQKTIKSQQAQFGREHLEVARSLSQLGMVRYSKGDDPNKVLPLVEEARRIISTQLGQDNPPYAEVLKNLAVIALSRKKFTDALGYLTQAEQIWTRKTGSKSNINAAAIFALTGDVYYFQRNYERAENFYNKGKDIYETNFSKNHPEYVKILSKLSRVYYMTKDFKRSKKNVEEAFMNYEDYIKRFFPSLTEREKARYWNTIRTDFEFYNTLAFSQLEDFRDLAGNVYNNQLLTKALLLSSSIKIRERIRNSGNTELIKTYNLWTKKNEKLTQALSMSTAQLAENEIDTRQLTTEVEQLERELSQQSEIFGQAFENKRITYESVQKSLAKNEVAIEIVRFRHFDHIFTDSVVYVGLYVRSDNARPKVIRFPYGNRLEKNYFPAYRNSVQYRIPDQFSYKAFWSPIEQQIGREKGNIYISADGVFNQVNMEILPVPGSPGRYIIDEFNIVNVNNTKDLYVRKVAQKGPQKSNTASLVGNPIFYSPKVTDRMFTDLPGTAMEISEVRQLLASKGWNAAALTETAATEEDVKAVENPKIFHIATHGFYSPAVEKNIDSEMTQTESQMSENPLMKSGLLLKGGGDILSLMPFNYNAENGVLTAYEAMSLNLDQTDLVVLSACETGAGEIANGEGVYGLQRAFLVAGAKVLIMSLFKVSDDATQNLIRNFYERWLQTGNMRLSLINAKKDVRREMADPLYWGSFIMIGLE